jgi:F-type H+-transporting ATPase subunit epsilon
MNTYEFSIRTPETTVFEGRIESVIVPELGGSFEILAGHAPLIGALVPGLVRVRNAVGAQALFVVGEGVVEAGGAGATLLTDAAWAVAHEAEAEDRLETYRKELAQPLVAQTLLDA